MLRRTPRLDFASDRAHVLACIERALGVVNARLGLSFEHDGTEIEGDVTYTAWADDVHGELETSWLRLVDDRAESGLYLDLHATDAEQLDALFAALSSELHTLMLAESTTDG